MTIDSHQHFWKYNPVKDAWITDSMKVIQRDFVPDGLLGLLRSNNMDGCVAVQADQSENETQFLIELAHQYGFIKGVVGWVDLRSEAIDDRLAYFSDFKIVKGFRHIVQAERETDFLLRSEFCRGIRSLKKYSFTYDLLIQPKHIPIATQFCKQFPDQKFVVDHLAKPNIKKQELEPWRKNIAELAKCENVFCKLSGMVTEADWQHWEAGDFIPYLDVVFGSFGTKRIMYGSDWPVCLLAASYEKQLALVTNYVNAFSESEREKIMGENAVNFYNL